MTSKFRWYAGWLHMGPLYVTISGPWLWRPYWHSSPSCRVWLEWGPFTVAVLRGE